MMHSFITYVMSLLVCLDFLTIVKDTYTIMERMYFAF